LLNGTGQFLSPEEYVQMQKFLKNEQRNYKSWDKIGKWTEYSKGVQNHVDAILDLGIIYIDEIRKRRFKVLLDCVNGAVICSS
jgi:phosphomannomutase